MGGGLLQLVAYGSQDVYLTGNPQITFFKVVYRRHTNFSMESVEQVFQGNADWGRRVTCLVSRNGDLIYRTYLRVVLPSVTVTPGTSFRWLDSIGHILIKSVEIEIGGQRIDKHYSEWLHIWNELTQTAGHQLGYQNMIGNTPDLTTPYFVKSGSPAVTVPSKILWIPFQFWFNTNPGLALPLIALQYHEVKYYIDIAPVTDCYWSGVVATSYTNTAGSNISVASGIITRTDLSAVTVPPLVSASLFIDYIYLDTEERRRMAQLAHEYLITQLQFTGAESTSNQNNKIKLAFNHPTKELVWVVQPDDNVATDVPFGKQWFNFSDSTNKNFLGTYKYVGYTEDTTDIASNEWGSAFTSLLKPGAPVGAKGFKSGVMSGVAAGGTSGVYLPVTFDAGDNPCASVRLQLNGHDRQSERDGRYHNLVQPFQHHENVPSVGINVYSFALKPEEHQPSGTCNMSRIDNATLNLTLTQDTVKKGNATRTAQVKIFGVNYNVLRLLSGMGGLNPGVAVACAC